MISVYAHFRTLGVLCYALFFYNIAFSQINITDPNAANTPNINKCFGTTDLETELQFTSNGANPAVMTVAMPPGIQYSPGSVMLVSQTGGLSITYAGGTPGVPIFNVTAGDGTINSGDKIRVKWSVISLCSATAGTVDFPISVNFGGTSTGEISTDIVEADLSITVHPIQSAAIGTPVMVPIVIQNGGLGATDNITFKIRKPA